MLFLVFDLIEIDNTFIKGGMKAWEHIHQHMRKLERQC